MAVTVMINLAVVRYESSEADRLRSEVLLADALQPGAMCWTSIAVIVALAGARRRRADSRPDCALVVAGFIGPPSCKSQPRPRGFSATAW